MKRLFVNFFISILFFSVFPLFSFAAYHFSDFRGSPPIHVYGATSTTPKGMTPAQIKRMYNLPAMGGHGTIAIIGAYYDPSIETDLGDFDAQFNIAPCTVKNGCFEKHMISTSVTQNSNWNLETTLDVEWAHAIAPQAHILLVEAPTPSGANLLKAIDYAAARPDVIAVSMSWGGSEFSEETTLDSHFKSKTGALFFASSGDSGTGASWPAASPYVIGVGGTSLTFDSYGRLKTETAWSGSGGGISAYEKQPSFQSKYSIPKSQGYRAVPDVAYDASPSSGFSIVRKKVWRVVGGTSAGAPQWAALSTLGSGAGNASFYADKASANADIYFRDILSGTNGNCGYICTARTHYDYVTGLGTPLTVTF